MKKTPKQLLELRHKRYREIGVKFGVWFMLFLGIIVTQCFPDIKEGVLDTTFEEINFTQLVLGAIVAIPLFSVFEKKGTLDGKMKNVGRILRSAFLMGFFWTEVFGNFF